MYLTFCMLKRDKITIILSESTNFIRFWHWYIFCEIRQQQIFTYIDLSKYLYICPVFYLLQNGYFNESDSF